MPLAEGRPGRIVAPGTGLLAVHSQPTLPVPETVPCCAEDAPTTTMGSGPATAPVTSSVPSCTRTRPNEDPPRLSCPLAVRVPGPTLTRSTNPFAVWSARVAPSVPEKAESLPSAPTNSVALAGTELITDPLPASEPTEIVRPFASRTAPAPRTSAVLAGSASPLAASVACDTLVPPFQRALCRSKVVPFASVFCASNPESATAPLPSTGTCTISLPRAPRERPEPFSTSALCGCAPGCSVTSEAAETASEEITRTPSRAMVPPAATITSAVPSSGGTAPPDQLPASDQRPLPPAPVHEKGAAAAASDNKNVNPSALTPAP